MYLAKLYLGEAPLLRRPYYGRGSLLSAFEALPPTSQAPLPASCRRLTVPHLARKTNHEPARPASSQGAPRSPLPHLGSRPALSPSLIMPPHPAAALGPGALRCKAASPPDPQLLRQNSGGPWRGARLAHHRGRWLGRKAEVRKWPARDACPSARGAASVCARTSGRDHYARAGRGEPGGPRSLAGLPARTVFTSLDCGPFEPMRELKPLSTQLWLAALALLSSFPIVGQWCGPASGWAPY